MVITSMGYNFENGKDYWAMPYINKAKELKLIDGTEFNTYRRIITREEASKIIVNALATLEPLPSNAHILKFVTEVPDYSMIAIQYKNYALSAYSTGLITGDQRGYFNPKNNLSRAEAAAVIMRLIDNSLRKPIDIDEKLSNTLPELLKTDEEVWGRTNIRSLTSLAEYDLKDSNLYFTDEPHFKNLLPKEILNHDINRQIHDLVKVLIDDNHFVLACYTPKSVTSIDGHVSPSITHVLFSKTYGYAYNDVSFFTYRFFDEIPYRLADDFNNKNLSNNTSISLSLNKLWWDLNEDGGIYNPSKDGWSKPYYEIKLKKSCLAVFGVETGSKIYQYVYGIYMDERLNKLNDNSTRFKTKVIDNIQVDFHNYGAQLNFHFTFK
jgi:hypothetical protein